MKPCSASVRRARPLLGTFVEITAADAPRADLDAAVDTAFGAVADVHRRMSFHEADSDVGRLNRQAAFDAVSVHPSTYAVLEMALELHAASAGAFDVAVVPASQTSDRPSGNRKGAAPAPARGDSPTLELPASAAGNATGSAAIELLAHNRVRFHDPRLRIDLGGIAKGFAVDRALAVLREHGVPRALVNAGGDLAAFGAAGQRIDVRDPRDPCTALCWVELGDEALASSGGGFDPFRDARPQEPAVIDPRSRVPVTAVRGATVRALSCLLADALTKVVMIAGASAAALLQRYGASALFLSASGELHISGDWHQRVHLAP